MEGSIDETFLQAQSTLVLTRQELSAEQGSLREGASLRFH